MGNALCVRMCCVRVWGLEVDKTKWGLCFRGFWQTCLCSVLFCWWHAVGCLEQHGCCSIDHPWSSRIFCWLWPMCFWVASGVGVVCWGGVLCENCIVDANAIKNNN